MRILIDGPQGSGKTTLVNKMMSELSTHTHHKFDSTSHMTSDDLTSENVILERGKLSELVYDYLWDAIPEVEDNQMSFKPITRRDIHELIESCDIVIILYSSDVQLLRDRIKSRAIETGRVLSSLEMSVLEESNAMFAMYGKILSKKYSHVEAIDVATEL